MYTSISYLKFGKIIAVILTIMATASGCGTLFSYSGAIAKSEGRILLEPPSPQSGTWQSRDLAVDYQYAKTGDTVELSGRVRLGGPLRHWHTFDQFYVRVHFLDSTGRIIYSPRVMSAAYRRWIYLWDDTFDRSFQVPEGTTAMIFSYSATVRSKDADWSSWSDPRRSDSRGFFF